MSVIGKADLRALYDLYYFVVKACMIGGGRVVVAVPTVEGSSGSKAATTIAAVVCWYPPRKRISALNAIRGGILRCLKNWGLNGLKVCQVIFLDSWLVNPFVESVCRRSTVTLHTVYSSRHFLQRR